MRTILLVEDNASFREMLRVVLQTRGFNVLVAEHDGEGLGLVARHDPDAVLTGFPVRRTNGLEFCRALREVGSSRERPLPVWVMAAAPELSLREAARAGVQGVFRKPFHVHEISKSIERHLRSSGGGSRNGR